MLSESSVNYLEQLGITKYVLRSVYNTGDVKSSVSTISTAWERLASEVSDCVKCSLCSNRTNTVFGVGNKNANLLIVGEAPGFYEDKQGEPFVGRAGGLLNLMLESIDLTRDSVYIANVIKCRPEKNRDPLPVEIATCTPYLMKQIDLLKPKLVLALGRYAAHFLIQKNSSLANLRGQLHTMHNTMLPLYVTYHPAYLLRNPKDKSRSFQDLLQVKDFLSKE